MNQSIFEYLNSFVLQNQQLDTTIIFCAEYLGIILIIIFTLFHLFRFYYPRKKQGLIAVSMDDFRIIYTVLLSALGVWVISQIINYFYFSPRPFMVLEGVKLLFEHGANDSLPSGHTAFFFTLAFMNFYYDKQLAFFLVAGAVVISVARIMVGIHWPIDILVSIALSALAVLSVQFLVPDIND